MDITAIMNTQKQTEKTLLNWVAMANLANMIGTFRLELTMQIQCCDCPSG